jgi:hypothetical protein
MGKVRRKMWQNVVKTIHLMSQGIITSNTLTNPLTLRFAYLSDNVVEDAKRCGWEACRAFQLAEWEGGGENKGEGLESGVRNSDTAGVGQLYPPLWLSLRSHTSSALCSIIPGRSFEDFAHLGRLPDQGAKPKRTFWVAGFSSDSLGAPFSDPKGEGRLDFESGEQGCKHIIVVLGKQLNDDGQISSELKGRVLRGLQLNETLSSKVGGEDTVKCIFSGGKGECAAMISFASQVIGEDAVSSGIICEDASNTTIQNAKCALDIVLQPLHEERAPGGENKKMLIWVVTSSYHLRRAVRVMKAELGRRKGGGRAVEVRGWGDFFAVSEASEEHEYKHRHNKGGSFPGLS